MAAFYGSIQIFKYLILNNVELRPSLWIYAIHGSDPSIIHSLEENNIKPKSYVHCLIEEIKCHHNDIAKYIIDNYLTKEEQCMKNYIIQSLQYYNFDFIDSDFIDQKIFYHLCQFDYFFFVDFLLKSSKININDKVVNYVKHEMQFIGGEREGKESSYDI